MSMDCQNESPDEWSFNGKLSSSAVCFTLSTVSLNSSPVSAKRISNPCTAPRTRSSVARLSFPPEYETVTGLPVVSATFFMKLCAFSSIFFSICMLAATASSHVLFCPERTFFTGNGFPFQRVFTAMPFSCVSILSAFIRALPVAITSFCGVSIMTSSSSTIPASASFTPGASTDAPFMIKSTAPLSTIIHFLPSASSPAPSSLGMNTHSILSSSNRSDPMTAPSNMTSSILSS